MIPLLTYAHYAMMPSSRARERIAVKSALPGSHRPRGSEQRSYRIVSVWGGLQNWAGRTMPGWAVIRHSTFQNALAIPQTHA